MHLWEIDHDYYCSESNYFSNEYTQQYQSWAEFFEAEGASDVDLNLVFRWDWNEAGLQLCYMLQRKGIYRCVLVDVDHSDEPMIRGFLLMHKRKLDAIWSPLV